MFQSIYGVALYTRISLLTGIVVGLRPQCPAIRGDAADYLRDGTVRSHGPLRLRQGLIIAQVAMTVVLLCGAGLLVRSLLALTGDATGVRADEVLSMRVELAGLALQCDTTG